VQLLGDPPLTNIQELEVGLQEHGSPALSAGSSAAPLH
jgi:hypothetical protein